MGMSLPDFEACTPIQFEEATRAFAEKEAAAARLGWEQARFTAMFALQPYSKKPLKPEDVCLFAWEKEAKGAATGPPSTKERMREIAARCGMKCD